MITDRQRIFIIISIVVGLVAVFLVLFIFVFGDSSDELDGPADTDTPGAVTTDPAVLSPPADTTTEELEVLSSEDQEKLFVKQLARIFVERFSSYSNENENSHIDDVMQLVTPRMATYIKTQAVESEGTYFGVTSVVVASRLASLGGSEAVVEVDVHQLIENGLETSTDKKSAKVNLTKAGGEWKVSGLFWD